VALHADDPTFRFVLIHVTSGEAGEIAPGAGATRENLGEVREQESRRSWVALGRVPDRHEWFRVPDHRVEDHPFENLVARIAAVLREERPDVVITFGPDGITGHPDHITVGRAASDAFHAVRAAGGGGFRRLLHNVLARSWIDAWNEQLVASGREPFDPEELYRPRGVPDETIDVLVDCSSAVERKLAALREHATQAGGIDEDPVDLGREAFLIAWPGRPPGTPVLNGVFDAL
jgi:LmbE family N-acetylglucosaminyl deacetylase